MSVERPHWRLGVTLRALPTSTSQTGHSVWSPGPVAQACNVSSLQKKVCHCDHLMPKSQVSHRTALVQVHSSASSMLLFVLCAI